MEAINPTGKDDDTYLLPLKDSSWPDVEPLPNVALLPVPKFSTDWLPVKLRNHIVDFSERSGCPIEYLVVSVMVEMAALIGRKRTIQPKQHDHKWVVVPNLWGAVVGRPSAMKSPAIQAMMEPLKQIEKIEMTKYQKAIDEFNIQKVVCKAKEDGIKAKIKKDAASGNPTDLDGFTSQLTELHEQLACEPTMRRIVVNDTTVEKLGVILNENPNGVLIYRDELIGFLNSIDRADRPNDKGFYLEGFNGSGDYKFDRIGRGLVIIESTTISILGGITPGKLEPYIRGAINQGAQDDGLLQRFQLLVYPDEPDSDWVNVDRSPNEEAEELFNSVFKSLHEIEEIDQRRLSFSIEAQVVFDEWRTDLECNLRLPEIHPSVESHLAKFRSLMPSIALILQIADDHGAQCVSEQYAMQAVCWCEYLKAHAIRIYSLGTDLALSNAHTILNRRDKLPKLFKVRDVTSKKWAGLPDKKAVEAALDLLLEHNYIQSEVVATNGPHGGRPSTVYHWNPNS